MEEVPQAPEVTKPEQVVDTAPNVVAPVRAKKAKIKSKHPLFNLFVIFSLTVFVVTAGLTYIYFDGDVSRLIAFFNPPTNVTPPPPGEEPPEEPGEQVTPPGEMIFGEDGYVQYLNKADEISFSFLQDADFTEPEDYESRLLTYKIMYTGARQVEEVINPRDMTDGYIVNLTVNKDLLETDLNKIALERRAAYLAMCPETANFSNIRQASIGTITALRFDVTDCDTNFTDTLFLRGNQLFQLTQIYRGDVGFEQVYRNASEDVVNSFRFINIIRPSPTETWLTKNYDLGERENSVLSFRYPAELDTTCCTLQGPISGDAIKVLVLADKGSVTSGQGQQFTGFGVFVYQNTNKLDFGTYLEQEKAAYIENYRVVIGREPTPIEEEITVGDVQGKRLVGYAWWGDVVYAPIPDSDKILFIGITQINPGEVEPLLNEVLPTFTYTEKE